LRTQKVIAAGLSREGARTTVVEVALQHGHLAASGRQKSPELKPDLIGRQDEGFALRSRQAPNRHGRIHSPPRLQAGIFRNGTAGNKSGLKPFPTARMVCARYQCCR